MKMFHIFMKLNKYLRNKFSFEMYISPLKLNKHSTPDRRQEFYLGFKNEWIFFSIHFLIKIYNIRNYHINLIDFIFHLYGFISYNWIFMVYCDKTFNHFGDFEFLLSWISFFRNFGSRKIIRFEKSYNTCTVKSWHTKFRVSTK